MSGHEELEGNPPNFISTSKGDRVSRPHYSVRGRWKSLEVSKAQKLKALEDENRRLKQIVADQVLDIQAIKFLLEKKFQGLTRSAKPLSLSRKPSV